MLESAIDASELLLLNRIRKRYGNFQFNKFIFGIKLSIQPGS
jgi:hypothetical protein